MSIYMSTLFFSCRFYIFKTWELWRMNHGSESHVSMRCEIWAQLVNRARIASITGLFLLVSMKPADINRDNTTFCRWHDMYLFSIKLSDNIIFI